VLTILSAYSLAPIYPLIISFLLARTGTHVRLGILFACACCGGAFLPYLTGALSTEFYGLRAGLIVPAAGSFLLLAISSVITARAPMAEISPLPVPPSSDDANLERSSDKKEAGRSRTP
jgi:fucose permease